MDYIFQNKKGTSRRGHLIESLKSRENILVIEFLENIGNIFKNLYMNVFKLS